MKTAEEYYTEFIRLEGTNRDDFILLINEARKETIEECAKIARTNNNCTVWNCEGESINKHQILSLINELK